MGFFIPLSRIYRWHPNGKSQIFAAGIRYVCRNTQGISECEEWSYEELGFEILGAEQGHELRWCWWETWKSKDILPGLKFQEYFAHYRGDTMKQWIQRYA